MHVIQIRVKHKTLVIQHVFKHKQRTGCPFVLFPLAIVLSVLRFTDSDYPFGIFKLLCSTYLNIIHLYKHKQKTYVVYNTCLNIPKKTCYIRLFKVQTNTYVIQHVCKHKQNTCFNNLEYYTVQGK